jgi:GNAT superfamily N-acetyltransferase
MDDLIFQKAEPEDSVDILALLQRISSWLAGKGIDQWKYFSNEKGKIILERRFREGEVYMVMKDGVLSGVFVTQWDDPFWHHVRKDDLACFIHTMGIDPSFIGKGIGKKILAFVEDIAMKAGKKCVRLDCYADNARLCRFYESNGLVGVGYREWEGRNVRLYEKKL